MILAIDTATRAMSLALYDGQDILAEQTWHGDHHNHTTQLAVAIQRLMAYVEREIDEVRAVAVSVGPGSYTGLRIGIALAKGFAGARRLPLVGISALDTLAEGHPQAGNSHTGLVAVVQAGRGRVIVQSYRWRKGRWSSARAQARLMTWDDLIATLDGPAVITGEVDAHGHAAIQKAQADGLTVSVATPIHRLRRAGVMAWLAHEQLSAAGDDLSDYAPERLLPVYVKSDEA